MLLSIQKHIPVVALHQIPLSELQDLLLPLINLPHSVVLLNYLINEDFLVGTLDSAMPPEVTLLLLLLKYLQLSLLDYELLHSHLDAGCCLIFVLELPL